MSSEHVERRLTAILAADVAGYSRLMGADEEGTLAQLKAFRKTLIVKTTGDGPRADVGCLAASSVWTAVRAIAHCGWSRYSALTV